MSMNPFCEIAIEEALRLRETGAAAKVVAATVGPAQSADTLRTAFAMGSVRAVHVHHDPDPARPFLPLAVAKILHAVALQEKPGLLISASRQLMMIATKQNKWLLDCSIGHREPLPQRFLIKVVVLEEDYNLISFQRCVPQQ